MRWVLASGNQHKAEEIASGLPASIELVLQSDLGIDSPPEPASTFVENALIKARHASLQSGLPALADDSGICVRALDGRPGVRSARFAGGDASDDANTKLLLKEMEGVEDREAFFYCVLVMLQSAEDPTPIITEGRWQGSIATSPAGNDGFGYDPVFYLNSHQCTAAELTPTEKNRFSHRAQALRILSTIRSANVE